MRRLKQAFAFLIIVVVSVMGYMLYQNYGRMVKEDTAREQLNPEARFSLVKPHFVEREGDMKVLEVEAEEAYYFEEGLLVELKGPKVVFYHRDGGKTVAKGNLGKINTETNDMELSGEVEVDTSDGYHLSTSALKYNGKGKAIRTDKKVRVRGGGIDVRGKGMMVKVYEDKLYIFRDVEAFLRDSK